MQRRSKLYIADILDCIKKVEEYVGDLSLDEVFKDDKTSDAVLRNIMIIGEAVSQLSSSFKDNHSNVPWQKIKDLRNIVIHKYRKIDFEIIQDVIKNKLPELKEQMEEILSGLE